MHKQTTESFGALIKNNKKASLPENGWELKGSLKEQGFDVLKRTKKEHLGEGRDSVDFSS